MRGQVNLSADLQSPVGVSTKRNILNAALQVFSEKGFEGASIRDISSRLGLNHSLIKYYFTNKDNLWKAAVAHLFSVMEHEMHHAIENDLPPEEKIKSFVRSYVRYCARHPEHARIMLHESIHGGERLQWAADHYIKPQRQRYAAIFVEAVNNGLFPRIEPISLVHAFVAACQNVFSTSAAVRIIDGVDTTTELFIDKHAEAIIALFFNKNEL